MDLRPMRVSRRQFLRASGATIALPFLPSLAGAAALAPTKRFVMMYVPNGLVRRCFIPGEKRAELPGFRTVRGSETDRGSTELKAPGTYPLELTSTMQPLAEHADIINLITGLDRPYRSGGDAHREGAQCYLSNISPDYADANNLRWLQGRTLDHVIGDALGSDTPLRTLEVSCNGFTAGKEGPGFDNISWFAPGRVAPSIKNPRKLYERLFSSSNYRNHLKDVTDLVLADANALAKKLAHDDRQTMDQFMTMIREIEVRISRLEKLIGVTDIAAPSDEILPRGEYIKLQVDLMLAALQMGITNVSTLMIGPERWEATLNYEGVFDMPVNHHQMSHNQKGDGYKGVQKIDLFHMEKYAYLLSRMQSITDGNGGSLLDNALVACGVGLGDGATHQYFDLPLMVAGKSQGAPKRGLQIQVENETPISNVWLTIAQHMGVEIDHFGNSTGTQEGITS
ncbi:MAG: hypothetical protein ACI8W8_002477 [Rhodothermales bacterium]|jgi:hypothetical protein